MQHQQGMHFLIAGKVQGVWFRASTQEEAVKLGLTGWARNLPNGQVEIVAFGEKDKLLLLLEWTKIGPPLAKVDDVVYKKIPWQSYSRFAIK